ncbi:DUF3667 domain-containing protein [Sinomicrobium weinanense]|uniref:DUF3667 domain-containing protein n=1 Tax=Sinomicrobium weinanense TaxID=2842200 RepID=A0A926JNT2_9FLAO|nr:DUF3667 domain-containing protein [Sinomicrobium weinanense]MBC9794626.1 DUF3667 domain-containing protein [Sinomicrobium weinanense]MBU3124111.1 DUF3667 domain-containing protein [Sinomicrobium weinanense]
MKTTRHLPFCLDCETELGEKDNYCPVCGQENLDRKVPVRIFIADFFSNYLSFDSTFFRTVPVFLYKPGKLTNIYNDGKRRTYLNPIRLYLIMSLFYFFMVSLIIPRNFFDQVMAGNLFGIDLVGKGFMDKPEIRDALDPQERAEMDSLLQQARENQLYVMNGPESPEEQAFDSTNHRLGWKELKLLAQDPLVSDSSFARALENSDRSLFDFMSLKSQRNFVANSNLFMVGFARNLPIMMFFLLPFFALILKLLYIRRPWYYVEHLIHGLHLHSFAYLIYGIGIVLIHFKLGSMEWIGTISFLVVSVYTFVSLLRVYGQGWLKTVIKFNVLGFMYFLVFWIALVYELYFSLKFL